MKNKMTISELAAEANVTPRTIRYYTSMGLLPTGKRDGRIMVYDKAHLTRLKAIQELKKQFLPLRVIRDKLAAEDVVEIQTVREPNVYSSPPPFYGGKPILPRRDIPSPADLGSWRRITVAPGIELSFSAEMMTEHRELVDRLIADSMKMANEELLGRGEEG